jgi:hypothetical protein
MCGFCTQANHTEVRPGARQMSALALASCPPRVAGGWGQQSSRAGCARRGRLAAAERAGGTDLGRELIAPPLDQLGPDSL